MQIAVHCADSVFRKRMDEGLCKHKLFIKMFTLFFCFYITAQGFPRYVKEGNYLKQHLLYTEHPFIKPTLLGSNPSSGWRKENIGYLLAIYLTGDRIKDTIEHKAEMTSSACFVLMKLLPLRLASHYHSLRTNVYIKGKQFLEINLQYRKE